MMSSISRGYVFLTGFFTGTALTADNGDSSRLITDATMFIESKLKDPTVRENALGILQVTEYEASKPDLLKKKYDVILDALESRKKNLPPFFTKFFQNMIDNAQGAYETLKNHNDKAQEEEASTEKLRIIEKKEEKTEIEDKTTQSAQWALTVYKPPAKNGEHTYRYLRNATGAAAVVATLFFFCVLLVATVKFSSERHPWWRGSPTPNL